MNNEVRISSFNDKYVGEDCIQIMTPFFNTMTLVDNNEILFHSKSYNNIEINI